MGHKTPNKNFTTPIDIRYRMCYLLSITRERRLEGMGTEAERQDTRKAMAFDLFDILDEKPEQTTYTVDEIKKIIRVYVKTADQK